jgi:hypothetical protein
MLKKSKDARKQAKGIISIADVNECKTRKRALNNQSVYNTLNQE